MRWLILTLAFPAFAQFSFTTPSGDQCSVTCSATSVFNPTPTPIPPASTGCASSPHALRSMGEVLARYRAQFDVGQVYAFPITTSQGGFGLTLTPTTPGGMSLEIGISKCPGDLSYYKTATVAGPFGSVAKPCGRMASIESAGVNWGPTSSATVPRCVIDSGKWYVNVRPIGASGQLDFFSNP